MSGELGVDLASKGQVSSDGAVLLGKSCACDAHDKRPIRVVTHCHMDHLMGLRESLTSCRAVLMTSATKDLLGVLRGRSIFLFNKIRTLKYGEVYRHEEEKISLFNAGHILGSAEVLLEDRDGSRVVYTGDFRLPEAEILECDLLIMEATYGDPSSERPFRILVEDAFLSLVRKELKHGPVYLFGYHGKLQEAMEILHRGRINAPLVMPRRIYEVAKICESHGMALGEYLCLDDDEAREVMKGPYIGLYHMNQRDEIDDGHVKIYLSGWELKEPCRNMGYGCYTVALSDHADFNQLLEYVERSKPKLVLVDNYRAGNAVELAREIRCRLKIPAKAVPSRAQ